jgi:hypothetical protein
MANIVERVGWVQVRVGGNSQESASMVASLPNGTVLAKDYTNTSGVTSTPPLIYTSDLLQMMENISKLVGVYWYLGSFLSLITRPLFSEAYSPQGIPFANAQNVSLAIVETGQSILGNHLLGFQAGNEPDLYAAHDRRPSVRQLPSRLNLKSTILTTMSRLTRNMTTSGRSVISCNKSPTIPRSRTRRIYSLYRAFKLYGHQKVYGILVL